MYRPPPQYADPRGGGRHPHPHRPPFQHHHHPQNPNYSFPSISPNPIFRPPNPYPQNPSFAAPPNLSFHRPAAPPNRQQLIQRIESAAANAHRELLSAGRSVSAWGVAESALISLKAESWTALGVQLQDVPTLHRLLVVEGKVGAFIHCFVGARRITTLYELGVAMCKNEGVERFEELCLGPLVRHPLVKHYFSVGGELTEIFKITSEDIVAFLRVYILKRRRPVVAEQFLDFLAEKKSVTDKEKLGVRIQSLGLHISCIREAKKAEETVLSGFLESMKHGEAYNRGSEGKGPVQPPGTLLELQPPGTLLERIKLFSTEWDGFGGKHIRFNSDSDVDVDVDDDGDDDEDDVVTTCPNQDSCLDKEVGQRVSSCPYPSTTEEMERLGLKSKTSEQQDSCLDKEVGQRVSSCPFPSTAEEMERLGLKSETSEQASLGSSERSKRHKQSNGKKRKAEDTNVNDLGEGKKQKSAEKNDRNLCKLIRKGKVFELEEVRGKAADVTLASCDMDKFITTWKEACREHPVGEVLDMMVDFYLKTDKKRKKTRNIFSVHPGIGLLHVAVASIKGGMLDSLYDAFQTIGEHGVASSASAPAAEIIEISPSVEVSNTKKGIGKPARSVSVDDITKKIADYFMSTSLIPKNEDIFSGKNISYLKQLCNCETWLTNQFSAKEFSSLGYGNFFDFLEKHAVLVPYELHNFLSGKLHQPSCLKVAMLDSLLSVLVSQVRSIVMDSSLINKSDLCMILKKQFPTAAFNVSGQDPDKWFDDLMKRQKDGDTDNPNCVLFSIAMLASQWTGNSLISSEKSPSFVEEMMTETSKHKSFSAVSSEDAIECLLRAPMLSDLLSWSHWDVIYAPSLGPLLEWLLNEVRVKDILCIATIDGRLIRIDNSATVEGFLDALIHCSSFQAALKLLSILSLYGGTKNAPLSLLKSYMRRAIDVIIKNSVDSIGVSISGENVMLRSLLEGQSSLDKDFSENPQSVDTSSCVMTVRESLCRIKDAVSVVSKFILECLGYFPREFWSFAADILVSGLRSFTKDAPLIILNSCTQSGQRFMLHDIGISLGITEWVEDYHSFCSTYTTDMFTSETLNEKDRFLFPESGNELRSVSNNQNMRGTVMDASSTMGGNNSNSLEVIKMEKEDPTETSHMKSSYVSSQKEVHLKASGNRSGTVEDTKVQDAVNIVESIRREEFGLEPNVNYTDSCLLRKQHARLGRALQCLSQELYSQDSHLLLELVQNADDNLYPENVDPTLVFILQDAGIVVLNNERGFLEQNIKALCDIGSSTKKGSGAGYIGHKGIGFKSVFRVTDAPEIHSNGFHVKFDITDGQIGFVLPTLTSPCDMNQFQDILFSPNDTRNSAPWGTCIVLPFRSKFRDGTGMNSIISMFSDLHPSLLLFLHRLRCIMFKNMLTNKLVIMRKETLGTGIVEVSHGEEKMSWLVVRKKLQASTIRQDVQTTEIAVAFTLQETDNGKYKPHLSQQPVFAFLPLRNYGMKFIIQGDFVLPSSREEVDVNSPWNQWLLSELPALFANAVRSFCGLPCFEKNQGKAVSAYMSFVPLIGEVNGFFSHLPHLIISKLRTSSCLLLEGPDSKWVLPCSVLRGWNEQARMILSDYLLQKYLGLGYLSKDVVLPDRLAKALGIQEYGPKVLIDIILAICRTDGDIDSLGLGWLSSWLDALYSTLSFPSSGYSQHIALEHDLISSLRKVSFIPLSDGLYSSLANGPIWLPCDSLSIGSDGKHSPKDFPRLYANLRTVNPLLFSAVTPAIDNIEESRVDNVIKMLRKVGVQQLSAHDVIKSHILEALDNDTCTNDRSLMIEYMCFIMLHFQYACASCHSDKVDIISELRKKCVLLTNDGYKCPDHEPIHFGKEYGNPVNMDKLTGGIDVKWLELDISYLKHPVVQSLSSGLIKWREFFQQLGVTDFVQVNRVDKNVPSTLCTPSGSMRESQDSVPLASTSDWESPELANMLSTFSSKNCRLQCIYLLEILDKLWDDCYAEKARGYIVSDVSESKKVFESSFLKSIREFQWIASSVDKQLHHSKELFHDCEEVRSILGTWAPYAVPKVTSKLLLNDIEFKTKVTLDDALSIVHSWGLSKSSFTASLVQMTRLYTCISDGVAHSKVKITEDLIQSSFVFVPFPNSSKYNNVVSGMLLSPKELYWQDPTGCADKTQEMIRLCTSLEKTSCLPCGALANIYPSLHDFFVNKCGVHYLPSFGSYVQILVQLSTVALPSQSAHVVFQVLLKWADDIKFGTVKSEEVSNLKEKLGRLENTVLPTFQDKWVSLHPSFGIICWSDDDELKQQFKHSDGIDFLQFGELSNDEKDMLSGKVAVLFQNIGVPSISELVSREAIIYGAEDNREKTYLINWILPFAQRYIRKLYPDIYMKMKQLGVENLNKLQVVVVEKLFYKYTLKGRDSATKKRFECSCLLQGNILYATGKADTHSLFLELSRLLLDGPPELHLANFLHMVTTMAESGATAEQTEFFIINTQKVPVLPEEEPVWSLSSLHELHEVEAPLPPPLDDEPKTSTTRSRKPGISPNWPPRDWKTAPGFNHHRKTHYHQTTAPAHSEAVDSLSEDIPVAVEVNGDWVIEEGLASANAFPLIDLEAANNQPQEMGSFEQMNPSLEHNNGVDVSVNTPEYTNFPNRNSVWTNLTGRIGEIIAERYFVEKMGYSDVRWVNKETETGLPYDLIVGHTEGSKEYIEVKTTRSSSKGWFEISANEWQFASECGDSFSIAHVTLLGHNKATVTVLKNPAKLCQRKVLQLAVLMSRQLLDTSASVTT